jgi:hypothetical protein
VHRRRQGRDLIRGILWTVHAGGWLTLAIAYPGLKPPVPHVAILVICVSAAALMIRWGFRREDAGTAIPMGESAAVMRRVTDNSIMANEALDRVIDCEARLDAYDSAWTAVSSKGGGNPPDLQIVGRGSQNAG